MNDKIIYDYEKLNEKINEMFKAQCVFAKEINMNENDLFLRLNSSIPFQQSEIRKICSVLDIDQNEIDQYFFKKIR